MKTRKQQIELLNDLLSGKKKIKDLPLFRVEIWTNQDCKQGYFSNGSGMVLTQEELEERKQKKGQYCVMLIEEKTYL